MNKTRSDSRPPRPSRARRLFSVEHANRALPLLRRIVEDIVRENGEIARLQKRGEVFTRTPPDEALRKEYNRRLETLRQLAEELADVGCELKDPERGLVDFPALHEGRPILLCWQLGEERVAHWHDLDSGFRGRQPVGEGFTTDTD